MFAIGVFATVALVALIAGGSPPSGGESRLELRADVSPRAGVETGPVQATIRRDPHGIPHITAPDFKGMGFGYGYAFAEDNICTMAETYVTVRAERSRYEGDGVEGTFGPSGSYPQRGNGFGANNLNSDFFYQRIIDKGIVESLLNSDDPATQPAPEIFEGVRGYVAGYNKFLADTGVNNLPDPRCAGKPWVKPISEMDAYRRFYQLALLASQSVAIDGIAGEKTPGGAPIGSIVPGQIADLLRQVFPLGDLGSNAYGIGAEGADASQGIKGIVLGNPHFPWDGPERFYQTHLRIPGEVNVSGASLYGVPLVLIGHTDNLAWSHTVSTAFRFTPFQETLDPTDPTRYLHIPQSGTPEFRDMTEDEVTVMARNDMTGQLEPRTRTIYSTHHGPVFDNLVGVPLPWTPAAAFSMGDVNASNFRYLNHFFEVNKAQSVQELDEIEEEFQGIPWVNTIAADSSGEAYYADIGAIPNVPDSKASSPVCASPVGQATFPALGLPVLNGALASCEWGNDPDAAAPGIFGYDNLPKIFRDDYVTNSNDSYWLSNPEAPLTGYARIIGDERTPRSLRTRIGLKMLIERWTGDQLGPADNPLDRQDIQDFVFGNRQYAGELWEDDMVEMCEDAPGGEYPDSDGNPVDVSEACPVLENWDLHENLDSPGAVLFRRFAGRALGSPLPVGVPGPVGDPTVFDPAKPFSPGNAVNTPAGLNKGSAKVQTALADAVSDLRGAGIPLNASLRDYQHEKRGAQKIPIHGGNGDPHGQFNAISASWSNSPEGFNNIAHGSSFVMVTQFRDTAGGACGADDRSILTYSQSSNPNSPYWKDQTEMFSAKEWVNPPFCDDEVDEEASDPGGGWTTTNLTGCLPGGCGNGGGGGNPGGGGGNQGQGQGQGTGTGQPACTNRVSGTPKPDRLRGTDGSDRIRGRHGNDRINGLAGEDCLHGGSGNDVIRSGDGERDLVRCGRGTDRVIKPDPADVLRSCEV